MYTVLRTDECMILINITVILVLENVTLYTYCRDFGNYSLPAGKCNDYMQIFAGHIVSMQCKL